MSRMESNLDTKAFSAVFSRLRTWPACGRRLFPIAFRLQPDNSRLGLTLLAPNFDRATAAGFSRRSGSRRRAVSRCLLGRHSNKIPIALSLRNPPIINRAEYLGAKSARARQGHGDGS